MRLYNAVSCTPVATSSMPSPPKSKWTAPKSYVSKAPWSQDMLERRVTKGGPNRVSASKPLPTVSFPQKSSQRTKSLISAFDPFDIGQDASKDQTKIQFKSGSSPQSNKGSTTSSANQTTSTDEMTPDFPVDFKSPPRRDSVRFEDSGPEEAFHNHSEGQRRSETAVGKSVLENRPTSSETASDGSSLTSTSTYYSSSSVDDSRGVSLGYCCDEFSTESPKQPLKSNIIFSSPSSPTFARMSASDLEWPTQKATRKSARAVGGFPLFDIESISSCSSSSSSSIQSAASYDTSGNRDSVRGIADGDTKCQLTSRFGESTPSPKRDAKMAASFVPMRPAAEPGDNFLTVRARLRKVNTHRGGPFRAHPGVSPPPKEEKRSIFVSLNNSAPVRKDVELTKPSSEAAFTDLQRKMGVTAKSIVRTAVVDTSNGASDEFEVTLQGEENQHGEPYIEWPQMNEVNPSRSPERGKECDEDKDSHSNTHNYVQVSKAVILPTTQTQRLPKDDQGERVISVWNGRRTERKLDGLPSSVVFRGPQGIAGDLNQASRKRPGIRHERKRIDLLDPVVFHNSSSRRPDLVDATESSRIEVEREHIDENNPSKDFSGINTQKGHQSSFRAAEQTSSSWYDNSPEQEEITSTNPIHETREASNMDAVSDARARKEEARVKLSSLLASRNSIQKSSSRYENSPQPETAMRNPNNELRDQTEIDTDAEEEAREKLSSLQARRSSSHVSPSNYINPPQQETTSNLVVHGSRETIKADTISGDGCGGKEEAKEKLSSFLARRSNRETASCRAPDTKALLSDIIASRNERVALSAPPPISALQEKQKLRENDSSPSIFSGTGNEEENCDSNGVPLKEDPTYAKYFKMLKMGLPMGAAKNAMQRDGLDPCVMDFDHSKPAFSSTKDGSMAKERAPKDTHRRTRLHWRTHSHVQRNTLWYLVDKDPDIASLVIDEDNFKKLFQAELKQSVNTVSAVKPAEENAVKVIDPKRANNGGIILARIKLSYGEIAHSVEMFDDTAFTPEQVRGIIQLLPTDEEKKSLTGYLSRTNSSKDALCECEKFMVAIMKVRDAQDKLDAILFKQKFLTVVEELKDDAHLVKLACKEVKNSVRFRKLIGVMLHLGNRLNTAGTTTKSKAKAVKLESLVTLNQAKAFDRKTTFLHFLVQTLRRSGNSLINFKDDMASIFKAQHLHWDMSMSELGRLESELEKVRRLALSYSRELQLNDGDPDYSSESSAPEKKLTLEEEVRLLKSTQIGLFILNACVDIASAVDAVESAKQRHYELLQYFGEEDEVENLNPNEVFNTIATFCKHLDNAADEVIAQEKVKARQARPKSGPPVSLKADGDNVEDAGIQTPRKKLRSNMGAVLHELKSKSKKTMRWGKKRKY